MRLVAGSATDPGRVREGNEDSVLIDDGIYAVADGMGGHRGGEVASWAALEALRDTFLGNAPTTDSLLAGGAAANTAVYDKAREDTSLSGMGTTLAAVARIQASGEPVIGVLNIGDSRVYLAAGDEFVQLTEDHSLVETMVRTGQLTAEEAAVHPRRNVITRALGIESAVEADAWVVSPRIGDRFVLCSDGLFNELSDDQIATVLRRLPNPDHVAWELVRLANEAGGRDNVSVVVVDVAPDSADEAAQSAAASSPIADRTTRITESSEERVVQDSGPEVFVAVPTPSPAPAPTPLPAPEPTAARPRRFTWRVGAFWLAIVALLAISVGAVFFVGHSGYFLKVENGQVVTYSGKREGLLWIKPQRLENTGIAVADLRPRDVDLIDNQTFGGRAAMNSQVVELRRYAEEGKNPTTTTTTTTTLVAPAAAETVSPGP
jgi:protein phosphatase